VEVGTVEEKKTGNLSQDVAGRQTCPVPPAQQPYEQAFALGFDVLASRELSADKLQALGVTQDGEIFRVPSLGQALLVDRAKREIIVENSGKAKLTWALLALHYLCSDEVGLDTTEVSLKHFADCRNYCTVFEKRIVGRFLATSGRTRERFEELCEQFHGTRISGPGVGYRFDVLPRVPITIVRHDEDEEFGPSATVIYRADAEHLLPSEDRIVAAELLLDVLSGKPIEERLPNS
jgi:hypothetical protein